MATSKRTPTETHTAIRTVLSSPELLLGVLVVTDFMLVQTHPLIGDVQSEVDPA